MKIHIHSHDVLFGISLVLKNPVGGIFCRKKKWLSSDHPKTPSRGRRLRS